MVSPMCQSGLQAGTPLLARGQNLSVHFVYNDRRQEHFWLCGDCSKTMILTCVNQSEVKTERLIQGRANQKGSASSVHRRASSPAFLFDAV